MGAARPSMSHRSPLKMDAYCPPSSSPWSHKGTARAVNRTQNAKDGLWMSGKKRFMKPMENTPVVGIGLCLSGHGGSISGRLRHQG